MDEDLEKDETKNKEIIDCTLLHFKNNIRVDFCRIRSNQPGITLRKEFYLGLLRAHQLVWLQLDHLQFWRFQYFGRWNYYFD